MKTITSIIAAIAMTAAAAQADSCDQQCDCRKQAELPATTPTTPNGVPEDLFNRIRAKAQADYPDDYGMQKWRINKEVAAYRSLQE